MTDTATPYGLIYAELWRILEASADFCELVPVGNRIRFDRENRDPQKEESITHDFPNITIVDSSGQIGQIGSSSSIIHSKTWRIECETGDLRLTHLMFPLEWAIVRALAKERCAESRLLNLRWKGEQIVSRVAIGSTTTSLSFLRGTRGWAEIMAVRTDICLGFNWL